MTCMAILSCFFDFIVFVFWLACAFLPGYQIVVLQDQSATTQSKAVTPENAADSDSEAGPAPDKALWHENQAKSGVKRADEFERAAAKIKAEKAIALSWVFDWELTSAKKAAAAYRSSAIAHGTAAVDQETLALAVSANKPVARIQELKKFADASSSAAMKKHRMLPGISWFAYRWLWCNMERVASTEQGAAGDEVASTEQGAAGDEVASTEQGDAGDEVASAEQGAAGDEVASTEQGNAGDEAASTEQDAAGNEGAPAEQDAASDEDAAEERGDAGKRAAAAAAAAMLAATFTPVATVEPVSAEKNLLDDVVMESVESLPADVIMA
ncbi:hypothetical protein GGI21_000611, partial [Coemansia aciculifera]